jgi:ribosomal protein L24
MCRATNPTHPDIQATSIIARSTFPGRIFAEVSSFAQAKNLATSIPELNVNSIKLLSPEQQLLPLFIANPVVVQRQTWVRIAGTGKGWKKYRGDIALVVSDENGLALVVIPRIRWNPGISRPRPPQQLCLHHQAKSTFGVDSISACDDKGFFKFQGRFYSREGFLVARLPDVDLCRPQDDLPTTSELELFAKCPLLESKTHSLSTRRISERAIKLHDRVKVMVGEYRGLFGRVVHVDSFEVGIYLESQDQTEAFAPSSVRLMFRTGDEVRILHGIHQGVTGWVVDVYEDTVKVLNLEKCLEVCLVFNSSRIV